MDQTLKLTPHESVTIREHSDAALVVEARWGAGGSAPPGHFHPDQDEHFEVLEGQLSVRVDGEERTLEPGEAIDIPRGTVHRMWNGGQVPARALWRTEPAGRTAEWFAALDGLQRSGRVGRDGMPSVLAFGAYLTEYSDVFRLGGPQALLRPALAVLGAVGRLRGYRRPADAPAKTAASASS
jgi:mannose-6-phosphate isomerase-like protein (cupin superfamily)